MPVEVGLGVRNEELFTGLEEAGEHIKEFASEFSKSLTEPLLGIASVAGLEEGARAVIEYGLHLQDLHERFDVSTTDLQHFGYVAQQNGVELDQVAMAFNRLAVSRSRALEGNAADVEAFSHLGISIQQLKSLSPEELMLAIGRSSMNAADMVTVLGRNGEELVPTLRKIADGSAQFGAALDENAVKALAHANSEILMLENRLSVLGGRLAEAFVVPALDNFILGMKAVEIRYDQIINKGEIFNSAARHQEFADQITAYATQQGITGRAGSSDASGPASPGSAGDGGDADGADKVSLAERLAQIDQEAALKRLSVEQQITAAQNEQATYQRDLLVANDPNERKEIEKEILESEREINRLKEEGARQEEEASHRGVEERLRAEERLLALKAENAKRAAQMAIDEEDDPQKKKQLIASAVDDLNKQIEDIKIQETFPATTYSAAEADEQHAKLEKQRLDLEEERARLEREGKEPTVRDRYKPEDHFRLPELGEIESIGGRLSGVDYHAGNFNEGRAAKNDKNLEDAAYYARKIYEKGQTSDAATFVNGAG